MIWVLVLIAGLLLLYHYFYKPQQYWRNKNVKQGRPKPFLGDSWTTMLGMEAMPDMVRRVYKEFKGERYAGVYQAMMPVLMLRDPELIKQITVKDFDHFVDHRMVAPENVDPLWTKNLFSLKGNVWREMRATISPTFTSSKMRSMFVLMEKSAQQYVDFYLNQNKNVFDIDLKDSFTRYATDVIANCAFGITVDSLKDPENEFYMNGKEATNFAGFKRNFAFMLVIGAPKLAKMLNITMFQAETTKFFKELIHDTITLREEQHIMRPDMINLMLEARKGRLHYEETHEQKDTGFATAEESDIGKNRTEQPKKLEITEVLMSAQIVIFFLAGFDTISTMMAFTCYELAVHPDIQLKLREEIDETYERNNGKVTYDVMNKMKYMDMVISESLRKNPPATVVDRGCSKAYTIKPELPHEHTVHLQPGDCIWLPIAGIHHDEELFPNPGKFDPERFSDENKGNIKPYSYIPFGSGPRNCIGSRFALMECKTLIFHILRTFELIVIKKTTIPMKLAKNSFNPAIEGGFWVGFKRRENIV